MGKEQGSKKGQNSKGLVTRTHQALSLFPAAVLYGSGMPGEVVSYRKFEAIETDTLGRRVERSLELTTKGEEGLPRGHDPLVLQAVLKLLFERGEDSCTVTFLKREILAALRWKDNQYNRAQVRESLNRYLNTMFRGSNLWTSKKKQGKVIQTRALIVSCDITDERALRYRKDDDPHWEGLNQLTRVVFNPDFINEIRGLPLALDFDILVSLQNPAVRRLFIFLNYMVKDGVLEHTFEVRQLAHNHLAVSPAIKAPSQCWNKVKGAFAELQRVGYVVEYSYEKGTGMVRAVVSSERVPVPLAVLEPIPVRSARRDALVRRLVALHYRAPLARRDVDALDEELLLAAETVVDFIERDKEKGLKKANFNYAGWANKELKTLRETGEINPELGIEVEVEEPEEPAGAQGDLFERAAAAAESFRGRVRADPAAVAMWDEVLAVLRGEMAPESYATWFSEKTVVPVSIEGGKLRVHAADPVVRDWVTDNYGELLRRALAGASAGGEEVVLEWEVDEAGGGM